MTTILEVMQGRVGIAEVPGKSNNPKIVQWFADCGRPEIKDDETANCAACIGSAAVACGLPTPPKDQVLLAQGWNTWGVGVELRDAEPGDLVIWPRGGKAAQSWQGHITVLEELTGAYDGHGAVVIGANQSQGKGKPDAVTRATRDLRTALHIRRAVPATVKDLRAADSKMIKQGDNTQIWGGLVAWIGMAAAAARDFFEPVTTLPPVKTLPETLSLTQQVGEGFNAVVRLASHNWWLAGVLFASVTLIGIGWRIKARRVAEHAQGKPLSGQLADVAPK